MNLRSMRENEYKRFGGGLFRHGISIYYQHPAIFFLRRPDSASLRWRGYRGVHAAAAKEDRRTLQCQAIESRFVVCLR
ncbi:MAG: hypothetical protein AB2588_04200 [Candidatus Thiodiazotropha sp.]|nr:hypothetical protein [Candidatus Thiodiazotropha taylori]